MRKRLVWLVVLAAAVGLLTTGSVASAKQATVTLTARLSGAQEVPAADPDGSGKATVEVDVEAGEVCFDVKLSDVGTPNRGHIHEGAAGVNGPIVVPFFELRIPPADPGAAPTDPRNDALEDGRLVDCVPGDPAVLARIVEHPENFYVNVHNARFPAGAMRCQLET
jgi:CHRD domain